MLRVGYWFICAFLCVAAVVSFRVLQHGQSVFSSMKTSDQILVQKGWFTMPEGQKWEATIENDAAQVLVARISSGSFPNYLSLQADKSGIPTYRLVFLKDGLVIGRVHLFLRCNALSKEGRELVDYLESVREELLKKDLPDDMPSLKLISQTEIERPFFMERRVFCSWR